MTDTAQRKPWGPWSRTVAAGALGAAVALAAGSAVAESGKEWAVFGGDQANTRYSALDQINTNNVKNLKVAWMHSLGSNQSQETTPLVIDGKMYLTTSDGPAFVYAVDAKTGETLWAHQPEMPSDYRSVVCCGHANRGLA